MSIQLDFLKKLPYFSGIGTDDINSIGKAVVEKTLERGAVVLLEGETAASLYFVVSGVVKTFKTSAEGKEQILSIVRPGDSFNDIPAFDGKAAPISAQTMGPVVLYEIARTDLLSLIEKYPAVAKNAVSVLAGKLRELVSLVEDLSFRQVIGRVARILLENAGDGAGHRLTQQDMAAIAGTAREVVGRSLKTLEEQGAIRLERHRIVISNRRYLEDMAGALV